MKKTFESEDVHAVDRAVKHSNHPDHHGETESLPDAGSKGVPASKSDASQISRPGENPGLGDTRAVKLNPSQRRAHGFNVRSEMGEANKEGGQ